jgi:cell division protein FtsB
MRSDVRKNRTTTGPAALLLMSLFALGIGFAPAQSQSTQEQIQQLKDKLQQLDQTMGEVKAEIDTLERQAQQPSPGAPKAPQKAAEKTEVVVVTANTPTSAPPSNTVPMEGEITSEKNNISIYGFAMLDSGYNFGQINPNWFDTERPTQLPSFTNEFAPSGNVYAGVRQSRFGVKSATTTPLGDLTTVFEFELFGTGVDAGQTTFRLRHAYGQLGAVGAGQTWSPFMDIDVFPNTIEYWGPSGMVFFRNVQARWEPVRSEKTSVALALERPGASADQGIYADRIELSNVNPRFNWPDLSGHVRIVRDWGHLQGAAIVRKIGWVDNGKNPVNLSGSAVGWGINVSSNLKVSKNNLAKLEITYGHGIENYMNDATVDIGIKANPPGSPVPIKGVTLPLLSYVAFLDHTWSEHYTSSVGVSMINIYNSDGQLPSAFHRGEYGVANLLYHPISRVTMGGEFQWGERSNFTDGFTYNDYKMQFSFKYDFSKKFATPPL